MTMPTFDPRATFFFDARSDVKHHCSHHHIDDRPAHSSWRIIGDGDVTAYIEGSPQEVRDFAERLVQAADRQDALRVTCGLGAA
jgi:hypothetical protein